MTPTSYKYIHGKNLCNEKKLNGIEENTVANDDVFNKIKNEDLFDDIPCVIDYVNRMAEKKRNIEKRKCNLVNAVSNDNWGEPISMDYDFNVEEINDMLTEGDVKSDLANIDCVVQLDLANNACVGHDELCKVIPPNNSDIADNDSHDNSNHGIFCVSGNESGFIDINSILDEDKMVI